YNGQDDLAFSPANIPVRAFLDTPGSGTSYQIEYTKQNRESDEASMKLGALTRIDFPTGGYHQFEYEANRAGNYAGAFVNDVSVGSGSLTSGCSVSAYAKTEFDFDYTEDLQYRYVGYSGGNPPCNFSTLLLTIDGGPVQGIAGSGSGLLADLYPHINFVVGQSYHLVIEKPESVYAYLENFELFYEQTIPTNVVGGLRVAKTTAGDNMGNELIRTYEYTQAFTNGESSGHLFGTPQYFGIFNTLCQQSDGSVGYPFGLIIRNFDTSVTPLSSFEGNHLVYERVIEHHNGNGHSVFNYIVEKDLEPSMINLVDPNVILEYPFPPRQARINSGNLASSETRNASGAAVAGTTNYPLANDQYTDGPEIIKVGNVPGAGAWHTRYRIRSKPNYRPGVVEEYLDGVTTTTNYEYNSSDHYFLTAEQTVNSDGKIYRTENVYAQDLNHAALEEKYMIGIPLETRQFVDGALQGGLIRTYETFQATEPDMVLPTIFTQLLHDGSSLITGRVDYYTDEARKGLPKEYKSHTHPDPEKEEYDYYTTGEKSRLLRQKNYADRKWTYDYKPNTGMLSQSVDIDGVATEYYYDDFKRLEKVAARNGALVQTFNYYFELANNGTPNVIETYSSEDNITRHQYFDGLGRPIQTVAQKYSPDHSDVSVEAIEYDLHGRPWKLYEPTDLLQQTGDYLDPAALGVDYTVLQYEDSPLNREKQRTFPGFGTVSQSYAANSSGIKEVNSGGTYAANELFRLDQTDENGHLTTTFTNKIGQLILTRRYESGQLVDTYHGYDDRGNLVEVLSPMSAAKEDTYSYHYEYDERNRLKEKTLPNQITTTYTYYPYDAVKTEVSPSGFLTFQYNEYLQPTYTYLGPGGTASGQEIIRNSYYNHGGQGTGQLSSSTIRRLDNFAELTSTYEYDNVSRLSHEKRATHLGAHQLIDYQYDGGTDRLVFQGRVLPGVNTFDLYTFDHAKRLKRTYQRVNGDMSLISENEYNHRDELEEKNLGSVGEGRFLQSIDYTYNERGWLTHLNRLQEGTADFGLNTCAEWPVGGSCEDAPKINLADLYKIRITNEELNIDCYDPCLDSLSVCDYEAVFRPATIEQIDEIVANGQVLSLPNYPYFWDATAETYVGLHTDLSDWLKANDYYYASINLDFFADPNFRFEILQSDLLFESINGRDLENGQTVGAASEQWVNSNCGTLILDSEDLANQALLDAMAATELANTTFPVVIYQVQLNDGQELLLTAGELNQYRGTYTLMACDTFANAQAEVMIQTNGTNSGGENGSNNGTNFVNFLILRQAHSPNLRLLGGGTCSSPPPIMCSAVDTIPHHETSLYFVLLDLTETVPNLSDTFTNFQYFTFLNRSGNTEYTNFVDSNNLSYQGLDFTGDTLELGVVGEFVWEVGTAVTTTRGQTMTGYKVNVDFSSYSCKEAYLGLYDGRQFVPINGGQPYLDLTSASNFDPSTIELTPDSLPNMTQLARMQVVLWASCSGAVTDVYAQITYETPCTLPPLCTTPLTACSDAEIAFQRQTLATLRSNWLELDIQNFPLPNQLNRVILCDGSVEYLFDHELAILQGNYTIVQSIDVLSLDQEFTIQQEGDDAADAFALRLYYQEGQDDQDRQLSAQAQFNGNIAHAYWQAEGKQVQRYAYQYDALDRLTQAVYADLLPDKTFATDDKYGVPTIAYDLNGNITRLDRRGRLQSCPAPSYGFIDILLYDYTLTAPDGTSSTSNQLQKVTDTAPQVGGVQALHNPMAYDQAGNLIFHGGKPLLAEYNFLNLPKKINFEYDANGSINDGAKALHWVYDSQGNKLQKQVIVDGNVIEKRDYLGGIEFLNDNLEAVYHAEGRWVAGLQTYTIRDHLGNSRVNFADLNDDGELTVGGPDSEVLQENHYYPFGMNMEGEWAAQIGPENKYQYNGKELNEDYGLDWLDYGWRNYDSAIGRWNRFDRLSEEYYPMTPYQYGANNPIKFIDVNGDYIIVTLTTVDDGGNIVNTDYSWQSNDNGEWSFYDSDGNIYKGDNAFIDEVAGALNNLMEGGVVGETLVTSLAQDENNSVNIVQRSRNGVEFTSGEYVNWNPNGQDGGIDTNGNTNRPAYIGLG
ncbi:MAG: DUF6443 domain-containing protein, partial [Bacteroidota bacterium]